MSITCPQCKIYAEAINQLVASGKSEHHPATPDQTTTYRVTISNICRIEVGVENVIDSLNHLLENVDEGMSLNVQAGILSGTIALLEKQIKNICKIRAHISEATC